MLHETQVGSKRLDMNGNLFNAEEFLAQHQPAQPPQQPLIPQNGIQFGGENNEVQDPPPPPPSLPLLQENPDIAPVPQQNPENIENADQPPLEEMAPVLVPQQYLWTDTWECKKLHFDETKCVVGRPDSIVDIFDTRTFQFLYSIGTFL